MASWTWIRYRRAVHGFNGNSLLVVGFLVIGSVVAYMVLTWIQSLSQRMKSSLHSAAHAPRAQAAQSDLTVRLWAGLILVVDVVAFPLSEGWVVYGLVPVRWICVVGIVVGGWAMVFPAKYRQVVARSKMR